jgi:ABC-2 type transport system ATP-binding protein
LLLDEPMSGLDPIGRKQFKDLIRRACREEGKTVFFCSHVLAEVEEVCDRVAILANGRLLTEDRLDRLQLLEEVIMRVEGGREPLVTALRGEGCTVGKENSHLLVTVTGEEQEERVEGLLKEHGARCVERQSQTETLEEFFVRAVTRAGGEENDA